MTGHIIAPAFAAAAIAVAGCGRSGTDAAATQVAARVNGSEISVRQVTNVLDQAPGVTPRQRRQAAAQTLDLLIDQELLVQKAVAARLDRDPAVADAIAAERRRILGLAWLDRTVPRAPRHGAEDVHKFFYANPALFERRRIYETRELVVDAPPEDRNPLKAAVAHAAQLDEVAQWLQAHGLPFHQDVATRPAEQVPLDMLPRLAGMSDGQIALFATVDRLSVLQLAHATNAPLTLAQATPAIERMLANRWRLESAMNEVRRLRQTARIEYLGPFEGDARPATPEGSQGAAGRLRLTAGRQPVRVAASRLY